MRHAHHLRRSIGGGFVCMIYLALGATCGSHTKSDDASTKPESNPDTAAQPHNDSGPDGENFVDSGENNGGQGSGAPTDTAGAVEPTLCPDHPGPGTVESIVLRGSFSQATGFYAIPDPFFVPGGMAALIKVKKEERGSKARLQLFTSLDGLEWDFHESCAIRRGEESGWNSGGIGTASMLKREDAVWVWYRADDDDKVQSIGLATGAGGCDWSDSLDPVFRPTEAWAGQALISPHVIERDGAFWMYYRGSNHSNQSDSAIGLATSNNGTEWTPHPENPIVPIPEADWNSALLADPHVWQVQERWLMLYSGHDRETNLEMTSDEVSIGKNIGLAASWDGLNWTHCYDAPLLSGTVKVDNPFVWSQGSDTAVYYHFSTLEDGSGGEIERVTWLNWPSWTAAR